MVTAIFVWGGYAAVWLWPESVWANGWRYSLEQDLDGANVVADRKPHDCEFLTAPIGDKHCHYDKRVMTVRVRNAESAGAMVSYDEGKTWQTADPSVRRTVLVAWERITE